MNRQTTISYAITVCNEADELRRLINVLLPHLQQGDEIVVQADATNVTQAVKQVVNEYVEKINKYVEHPLKFDFAQFKNHLNEQCTGDFIFQLDADEQPCEWLLDNIKSIIRRYWWVELFKVPRINLFDESKQRESWPDYQGRIYKNCPGRIKWRRPLHERIHGHWLYWHLPKEDKYALIHIKVRDKNDAKWEGWMTHFNKQ